MLSRVVAHLNAAPVAKTFVRGFAAAPSKKTTLQSTVNEIKHLSSVYSIAASANHLSKDKLEFVVREIKSDKDLPLVREALELYERNFLSIPAHCTGTFVSKCIQNNQADLALEWMAGSKSLPKFIVNGTAANLIDHFGEAGQLEKGLEVFSIVKKHNMDLSTKVYNALVISCKKQGNTELAFQYASEACQKKMMNSHGILGLLEGLTDAEIEEKLPTIKSLIHLGDVYVNKRLEVLLDQISASKLSDDEAEIEVEIDEDEDDDEVADEEVAEVDEIAETEKTDTKQA
ncbi:Aste57867_15925 [Aphanomyces stellatus]|uniref:Aste57867_15925 protein n=1 Tax=Aphanomyces stellatus TaxID=120398 RepID=A0A485L4U0_9STRA|nr:hypothetical protein As57867_015869 [Aphanomyces stellatus]VFT92711.1 Aste57867_15925 [Aphanomyces stellatus]